MSLCRELAAAPNAFLAPAFCTALADFAVDPLLGAATFGAGLVVCLPTLGAGLEGCLPTFCTLAASLADGLATSFTTGRTLRGFLGPSSTFCLGTSFTADLLAGLAGSCCPEGTDVRAVPPAEAEARRAAPAARALANPPAEEARPLRPSVRKNRRARPGMLPTVLRGVFTVLAASPLDRVLLPAVAETTCRRCGARSSPAAGRTEAAASAAAAKAELRGTRADTVRVGAGRAFSAGDDKSACCPSKRLNAIDAARAGQLQL